MLREAREQTEKAISARNSADRERDDAMTRYEEKCREMERYAESMSNHLHSMSNSVIGGRRETREWHESSGHSHGHAHRTVTEE
jgi:hypothetical protein